MHTKRLLSRAAMALAIGGTLHHTACVDDDDPGLSIGEAASSAAPPASQALAHPDDYDPVNALMPAAAATYVAVRSGNWDDPTTWGKPTPPVANAKVFIPATRVVTVRTTLAAATPVSAPAAAAISWIRVEGTLRFSATQNTSLLVDTVFIDESGVLEMGTPAAPIGAAVACHLWFSKRAPRTDDPSHYSRGLISAGKVVINGAPKTNFVAIAGTLNAGVTTIPLQSMPVGWRVGDEVIIAGTYRTEEAGGPNTHDEIRKVVSVATVGGQVQLTIDRALSYAHDFPAGRGLSIHVANISRSVTLATESGDSDLEHDAALPLQARAHSMFLSTDVALRNAAFVSMGRTKKDLYVTDPKDGPNNTNPRGRYPIHLHKAGLDQIVEVSGNVILHSPGWGVAVHSGEAKLYDNVSYDVLGAHYVTEAGDERVWLRHNIAIRSKGARGEQVAKLLDGINDKRRKEDFASSGMGFWIHQAYSLVEFRDNVAAGQRDVGLSSWGHADKQVGTIQPGVMVPVSKISPAFQALYCATPACIASESVISYAVPFTEFQRFVTYNSEGAIHIQGHVRDDAGYDSFHHGIVRSSVLKDLVGFNLTDHGVDIDYSAHLTLQNVAMYGNFDAPIARPAKTSPTEPIGAGIWVQKNGRHISIENPRIEGFFMGLVVPQSAGQSLDLEARVGSSRLVGGTFAHNTFNLYGAIGRVDNPAASKMLSSRPPFSFFFRIEGSPSFSVPGANHLPVARFTATSLGGNSVHLDAKGSADSLLDYTPESACNDAPPNRCLDNHNNVAAFAWDFNGDNIVDAWGRELDHRFDAAGAHPVTLRVYDSQGASSAVTTSVTSTATPLANRVYNFDFTAPLEVNSGTVFGEDLNAWLVPQSSRWSLANGALVADAAGSAAVVQIIEDQRISRGARTLKIDRVNTGATLSVAVYGVNGTHFTVSNATTAAPASMLRTTPAFTSAALLDNVTVPGTTAAGVFQTASMPLNFGAGYDYIVVKLFATAVPAGTDLRVDNVRFAD